MIRAPEVLPEFDNPPVVEVVLGVAFEPLTELTNLNLTRLWLELFQDRFPVAQEKAPYNVSIEAFPTARGTSVTLAAASGPPPVRLWLISEGDRELVQVQSDWFARNWRKIGEGDNYPRYEKHIRPAFHRDFEEFVEAIEREELGKVVPTQCEVTYINHIRPGNLFSSHSDVGEIFRDIPLKTDHDLGPTESVSFRVSRRIYDQDVDEAPLGRLHLAVDSAFSQRDSEPMFIMNLTARGQPIGSRDVAGVLRFADLGRQWAAGAFLASTTERAHNAWNREY